MKEKVKIYTVEREFLSKFTVSDFVSKIVAAHLKCEEKGNREESATE